MGETAEPQILLTGLAIGESPRWHEGRLWFSNWGTQEIVAVDIEGNSEVMARVPTTIPFSIDWLPDGRMIVVSGPEARLLRHEPDGTLVTHADLSGLVDGFINEIVVDPHGNAYVNGGDFDFSTGAGVESGFSRAGASGRLGAAGGRQHRVRQRYGHHRRRLDVDRRRVLGPTPERLRHCRGRWPVESPDLGRYG